MNLERIKRLNEKEWLVEGIVSESTGWWKEDWLVEGKVSLLVGGRKTGWWKEKLFYEPITPTFTPLVHGASVAPEVQDPLHYYKYGGRWPSSTARCTALLHTWWSVAHSSATSTPLLHHYCIVRRLPKLVYVTLPLYCKDWLADTWESLEPITHHPPSRAPSSSENKHTSS